MKYIVLLLVITAARMSVSATVVPDCLVHVDGNQVKVKCTKGATSAQITVRNGSSNGVVADAKNVSAVTLERVEHDVDYVATIDL